MSKEMEEVVSVLNELDWEYNKSHDGELVDIPGYGRIYFDDQPGVEPGLVVEDLDGKGCPITLNNLKEELYAI